ncbi:DUF7002 family protein [Pseudonocardia alni]|uniref:DUF7002 family protein n=1 Tax=Pseudonocardia alni TaxID=33907 RepID=UPI0037147FD8
MFHTTPAASWPGIATHGLLPVAGLLDLFGVTGDERERLLTTRRPRAVRLHHPEHGVVLTVDTASLLAAHGDRVLVTRINSGAALFARGRRGPDTFLPVDRVPSSWRPVEVAVPGGVRDLLAHLVDAPAVPERSG